jgi:hypothetical protein
MTNILTAALLRNKDLCLDDPKLRQRYTKNMTAKEKERFAKTYVCSLLETKEEVLRFQRITNPSLHKIYKDTYESGGNDFAVKQSKGNDQS